MTENETTTLTTEQQQRREALKAARATFATAGLGTSLPERVSAADLADLAEFIMSGAHPFDRYPDAEVEEIAPDAPTSSTPLWDALRDRIEINFGQGADDLADALNRAARSPVPKPPYHTVMEYLARVAPQVLDGVPPSTGGEQG